MRVSVGGSNLVKPASLLLFCVCYRKKSKTKRKESDDAIDSIFHHVDINETARLAWLALLTIVTREIFIFFLCILFPLAVACNNCAARLFAFSFFCCFTRRFQLARALFSCKHPTSVDQRRKGVASAIRDIMLQLGIMTWILAGSQPNWVVIGPSSPHKAVLNVHDEN